MVLNNNGATGEDLTITATGASIPFTFQTKVSLNYKVTVKTQPSTPAQNCSVSNGSGVATGTVTTVQVTCVPVFTVGGNVSGLDSAGLVLQDNGGDDLAVTNSSNNVSFTFGTPLASGATYAVTIKSQPTNPPQTCVVVNGRT